MKLTYIALTSLLAVAPCVLLAQTAPTVTPTPGRSDHNINARKTDQQDRIANGVQSGQLTAGETSHLEHQEAGFNKEEAGMRAQDNGKLTKQDRSTLHHQQNVESRRIYRDKHNSRVR
jgi:phage-related tail fiber protein